MTAPAYHERSRVIFRAPDLTANQRLILLAVSDHLSRNGEACWPSLPRLCEMTALSDRTIQRQLRPLEERGVVTVERSTGLANRYQIAFDRLTAPAPTPDTVTGVPESNTPDTVTGVLEDPRHADGGPPTERHPTPVTVTGDPRHSDARSVPRTGQRNEPENVSPPSPPGGDAEDEAPAKKPPARKRRRGLPPLKAEAVLAVPVPLVLRMLDGFADRWAAWVRIHQASGRGKWRETGQVEAVLRKLETYHGEGLDVLDGLQRAYEAGWQGINRDYLAPRQETADGCPLDAEAAWSRVSAALAEDFALEPPGRRWWLWKPDPRVEDAFRRALCTALDNPQFGFAWMHLRRASIRFEHPRIRRRFLDAWAPSWAAAQAAPAEALPSPSPAVTDRQPEGAAA